MVRSIQAVNLTKIKLLNSVYSGTQQAARTSSNQMDRRKGVYKLLKQII